MKLPRTMNVAYSSRKKSGTLLLGGATCWLGSTLVVAAVRDGETGAGARCGGANEFDGLYGAGDPVFARLGGCTPGRGGALRPRLRLVKMHQ